MNTRVVVRELLEELFATDAELEAYCRDRFNKACRQQWADAMNRTRKINLLLDAIRPEQLLAELRETHPIEVADALCRHEGVSMRASSATPSAPSDPEYKRLPRTNLVEFVCNQLLRTHSVATLLHTWRGGGQTLARQIVERATVHPGLATVWLTDLATEDSSPPEFYCLLTGDPSVRNQVDFSEWLHGKMAGPGLLIVLLGTHGPELLLSQVAAVVRSHLSAHSQSRFLVVGGERILVLRQHKYYPWLRLLPPVSYFDVPDFSLEEVSQLLLLQPLPIEHAPLLYSLTGGHPWLLHELIRLRLFEREAAESHIRYQISQAKILDRHLSDPEACEVLRKLRDGEEVASLADPCIRHNPSRPECRLYFDGFLTVDENGRTMIRGCLAKMIPK